MLLLVIRQLLLLETMESQSECMDMNLEKQVAWHHGPGKDLTYGENHLLRVQYDLFVNIVWLSVFRIAVYKVLYRLFGGYVSDVVAAIEQVCKTK